LAMAAPMPFEAPVTTATFPANLLIFLCSPYDLPQWMDPEAARIQLSTKASGGDTIEDNPI